MKNRFLYPILVLCFFALYLTSCSTMNLTGEQAYISSSIYKGGYWGSWDTEYSLKADGSFFSNGFSLLLYNRTNHPSDFNTRVTAKNFTKKDGDWLEYIGTVELDISNERIDRLGDFYTTKINLYGVTEKYITFPCIIRISKPIKDILKKHGTINIFYNGVGRAYSF